jgi:hypothetical protein
LNAGAALVALMLAQPIAAAVAPEPLYVDAGVDLGHHVNGRRGELFFVEMMGAGVALFDHDQDGDLDALVLDGTPLGKAGPDAPAHGARLYRNEGLVDGRPVFRDVTAASGLRARGYGFGVATGDIDNDGDVDLFLANYGADQLWRNRGDGTFEDVTQAAGVGDERWSTAATFFDLDRDGWLDLYVANYVDYRVEDNKPCYAASSRRDYCGPQVFPPQANRLWRNRGDGTFVEITAKAGMAAMARPSLGVVAVDADLDGWLDLYVADDGTANELWRNRGDGTFEEVGLLAGVALNADGQPEASMGVLAADFDEDGDEDLFLTHIDGEKNTLYVNLGGPSSGPDQHSLLFEDRGARLGLDAPSRPFTSFGTAFVDLDHDGWRDVATVSGAVRLLDALLAAGDPVALAQRKQLFRNREGRGFEDWSARGGETLARPEVARGLAAGDVDDDGDVDLLVGVNGGTHRLLLRSGAPAGWLGLRLRTGKRDAYGARVELERRNAPTLHRRVATDGSYGAAGDPRLLFGLAAGREIVRLRVIWPDGRRELFEAPPLRRYTTLVQGRGQPEE